MKDGLDVHYNNEASIIKALQSFILCLNMKDVKKYTGSNEFHCYILIETLYKFFL